MKVDYQYGQSVNVKQMYNLSHYEVQIQLFLYFLNIFKSNVQSKPKAPKTIIKMGTDLSSFISSLKLNRYHRPTAKTNTEIIKLIMKNKSKIIINEISTLYLDIFFIISPQYYLTPK